MSAGLFEAWCAISGFDLGAFDRWLERLPACGAREELTARRALAETALLTPPSNPDAALRHLEWLLLRQREIQREDAILPLAKSRQKQIDALTRPAAKKRADREKRWAELQAYVDQQHDDFPYLSYDAIKKKAVRENFATVSEMKHRTTRWK